MGTSPLKLSLIALLAAFLLLVAPARLALASNDGAHEDHHAAAAVDDAIDPELDVDMHDAPPPADKKAYAAFLRGALAKARPHVVAKLEQKMVASQSNAMDRLSAGLFLFSLLGVLLLLRPLFLAKRFPGQGKTLFKYALISAGLFFLTVNLFAMVIGLLKVAQGSTAHLTNPQIAIATAAFDVLDKNAEDLVDIAPKLIEPSLHQLAKGDADFIVVLLENFKGIKSDIDAILAIAKLMKALDGVLAYLPALLTVIAIVTFAVSAKDTLLAIVKLPETAVESGGAGVVIRGALRRVKNELLATLCLIGCVIVLAIGGGIALRAAVEPAIEAFLDTVFLAAIYIQVEKVSSIVLFGGLGLGALILVLNIGVVMAASSAALSKLHKIFQRKFHEGLPLSAHGRFWKRAPLALLLCFVFPVVYNFVAEKGVEAFLHHTLVAEHPAFGTALVGAPAGLCIGFVVCFAVCLGGHAMVFLFRYPVKAIALAPQPAILAPALMQAAVAHPMSVPQMPVASVAAPSTQEDELNIFDRLVAPTSARLRVAPTQPMSAIPSLPAATTIPQIPQTKLSPQAPLAPESDGDVARTTVFRRSGIRPLSPVPVTLQSAGVVVSGVDDTVQMPSPFLVSSRSS